MSGLSVHRPLSRPELHLAVLAMEASIAYPIAAAWLGGAETAWGLGPLVCVGQLVLGYLASSLTPRLTQPGWPRLGYGVAASLGLRLLVSPLPADPSPGALLGWVGGALFPAALGLALWWRGASLPEAEVTAGEVRTEFAFVGFGMLVLLGMLGHVFGTDPLARVGSVLLFLCGGMLAVGLARQEAAGSPRGAGSRALVAVSLLVFLLLAAGLVAALSPDVVSAMAALAERALLALVQLLMIPLAWLFSGVRLELPAQQEGRARPALPPDLVPRQVLPEWLQALLGVVLLAVMAVLAIVALVVLAWLIWELWQRLSFRLLSGSRAPAAMERDGSLREDAQALLAALRGWLARLAAGSLLGLRHVAGEGGIRSAEAAYRALLRWAKHQGLERDASETPLEFERRLAAELPHGAEHYALLTRAYELARYGDVAAGELELARLRRSLGELVRLSEHAEGIRRPA